MIGIDQWPCFLKYPIGHIVKVMGKSGDIDVENNVILYEYDVITTPFS